MAMFRNFAQRLQPGDSGREAAKSGEHELLNNVSVAVMHVDRNFIVTYVNTATRELLRKNAAAFRTLWPTFDAERIVGTCIDIFHKNPDHQRRLLSDPSRLPYKTEITIGDLKVMLNINGLFDAQRNYIGNMLEWSDVTGSRLNEGMIAAINASMAVIEFTDT